MTKQIQNDNKNNIYTNGSILSIGNDEKYLYMVDTFYTFYKVCVKTHISKEIIATAISHNSSVSGDIDVTSQEKIKEQDKMSRVVVEYSESIYY